MGVPISRFHSAINEIKVFAGQLAKSAQSKFTKLEIAVLELFCEGSWAKNRSEMLKLERQIKKLDSTFTEKPDEVSFEQTNALRLGVRKMQQACESLTTTAGFSKTTLKSLSRKLSSLDDKITQELLKQRHQEWGPAERESLAKNLPHKLPKEEPSPPTGGSIGKKIPLADEEFFDAETPPEEEFFDTENDVVATDSRNSEQQYLFRRLEEAMHLFQRKVEELRPFPSKKLLSLRKTSLDEAIDLSGNLLEALEIHLVKTELGEWTDEEQQSLRVFNEYPQLASLYNAVVHAFNDLLYLQQAEE